MVEFRVNRRDGFFWLNRQGEPDYGRDIVDDAAPDFDPSQRHKLAPMHDVAASIPARLPGMPSLTLPAKPVAAPQRASITSAEMSGR